MRVRMHRMEGLIEGLLHYSRAGRTHGRPEIVDVAQLVQDVIDLLSPSDSVSLTIETDLPTLETERLLLQQVFMNLIGNAIKHANRADPPDHHRRPSGRAVLRVLGQRQRSGHRTGVSRADLGHLPDARSPAIVSRAPASAWRS